MTLGDKGNGQGLAAQQVFGPQAAVYATSKVHIRDDSLESVERMVDAANGSNRYGWTVDLGTGAGFTAFAVAGVSDRVIATDVTEPMLRQAKRLGAERGIANLGLSQNAAEALPFAEKSIDLVTSRVSAHHFRDFEKTLDEAQRVLKPGGSLLMADSVAPEDDAITICIRPEDVATRGVTLDTANAVQTGVETLEFLGSFYRASLAVQDAGETTIRADFSINLVRDLDISEGQEFTVALPSDHIRVYGKTFTHAEDMI